MGSFLDRWRGTPIKLTDGAFWRGFFGLGTTSGEVVTIETALQLDAVWACVNLIRNAIVMLPCLVYKEDGVTVDKESDLYQLLHDMPKLGRYGFRFLGNGCGVPLPRRQLLR